MKSSTKLTLELICSGVIVVLIAWFLACPITAAAQSQGQNAVCTTQSGCASQAPSPAFFDAFMFLGGKQGQDFCDTIYGILAGLFKSTYPSTGAVIDARAISGSALKCTKGTPWFESSTGYANVPSTILLPSGTIQISSTWILPNGTKLIGEETTDPTLNTNGTAVQTTIQATTSMSSGTPMIQFGDSTHCPSSICTGISVEHLTGAGPQILLTANTEVAPSLRFLQGWAMRASTTPRHPLLATR